MLETQTKPPWKTIEFFKSPTVFQNNKWNHIQPIIPGTWLDATPEDLTKLKNGIGEKEQEANWDLAKRITNPYELIYTTSKHAELPQSISTLKPLSRSFFKLIEILKLSKFFDIVKPTKYKTLHLCEGPGGFIEAFIDRAQLYRKQINSVHAMTLKQINHNIPGWRAATRFLSRHPEIQIEYGPSGTGDILLGENQEFLSNKLNHSVHLVTADGGFDFSIDFEAQEKLVFPLLVASAYIALSCLAPGGYFVLKIFDSYSPITKQFLALLAVHFKEYTIYKPATSRPCNSERYFIGMGFRIFSKEYSTLFKNLMDAKTEIQSIWNDDVSNTIINTMDVHIEKYVEEQKLALQHVLSFPTTPTNDILKQLWNIQEKSCVNWCNQFSVPSRIVRPTPS